MSLAQHLISFASVTLPSSPTPPNLVSCMILLSFLSSHLPDQTFLRSSPERSQAKLMKTELSHPRLPALSPSSASCSVSTSISHHMRPQAIHTSLPKLQMLPLQLSHARHQTRQHAVLSAAAAVLQASHHAATPVVLEAPAGPHTPRGPAAFHRTPSRQFHYSRVSSAAPACEVCASVEVVACIRNCPSGCIQ